MVAFTLIYGIGRVAVSLKTSNDRTASDYRAVLRYFLKASWRHKPLALLAFLQPISAMLTNVGVPFFAGRAIASIALHNGAFAHNMWIVAILAGLGVIGGRIGFIKLMSLQAEVTSDLSIKVFDRLMDRSISFHTNQISGKLISDAIDFVGSYMQLSGAAFNNGFSFLVILISGLIVVSVSSWQLGLFLFCIVVVTLTWALIESSRRTELRHVRLEATRNVTAHLSDSIVNAQTVKMFSAEVKEKQENQRLNKVLKGLRLNDWRRAGISGNNRVGALLGMLILLLLLINYLATKNPEILATGIFAYTYTFTLILRLFDLNTLTRQVEEAFLQASPMMKILEQPVEIQDKPDAADMKVDQGRVELRKVSFRYDDNKQKQAVFSELNIDIKPGERVGLIGPSGGGKSTLTKLLLRLEDVQSGEILVDGQNISAVTQASLRNAIAYVPQEPLLFHRSIKENIGYGKTGSTLEAIRDAAKLAHADTFIGKLPKAYDTVVGERGVKLSGGQRQRVAIARAILKNAPILILDEATSALDSESEKAIQEALWELMQDKTALVIAHRLSTIQKLDRILVLDEGRVIEEGSHESLLAKKGLYARLWNHQSGGFIQD